MFAQVLPLFQISGVFSVIPSLYNNVTGAKTGLDLAAIDSTTMSTITPNTTAMGVCAILALAANVVCLSVIKKKSLQEQKTLLKQWKEQNKDIKISIKKWASQKWLVFFCPIMHIFSRICNFYFLIRIKKYYIWCSNNLFNTCGKEYTLYFHIYKWLKNLFK